MTKTAVAELMKNFKLSDLLLKEEACFLNVFQMECGTRLFSAKWFLIYDYKLL